MTGPTAVLDTIARVLAGIGGLFLLGAFIPAIHHAGERRRRNRFARMPLVRCADLGPSTRLRRRVAVRGTIVAGLDSPLTAPLSNTECVWYQLRVWREYHSSESDAHVAWESTSGGLFGVADGSGVAYCSARLLGRDALADWGSWGESAVLRDMMESPWASGRDRSDVRQLEESGILPTGQYPVTGRGADNPLWVEEKLVRPGHQVTVIGVPVRWRNRIVLAGGIAAMLPERAARHRLLHHLDVLPIPGPAGMSEQSLEELRAHSATEFADTRPLVRALAWIGLPLFVLGWGGHWLLRAAGTG